MKVFFTALFILVQSMAAQAAYSQGLVFDFSRLCLPSDELRVSNDFCGCLARKADREIADCLKSLKVQPDVEGESDGEGFNPAVDPAPDLAALRVLQRR